ncbi:SMP-30/gluconolactonase/LRE family protein [Maribacter sp. HTCC2170]|uniref:SMP-30/gluconolactonase/LRE family protein n=1 Tax=Maribacter sp. (strain HTCC2170 / KCCM 42371) TaxID=313603 RepID=UPI00006B492A|nr:SMP-30/gluconolactonase/LRE family protein [Maribacter sp. HTCC2170]EAR00983.1 paraoxonase [Maribacter sp. HTCC2170]
MRILKKVFLLFTFLVLLFIGHVLISTGYFRTIEPQFQGKILKRIPLVGAEDIMISRIDSFALISSTDRAAFPPETVDKGGLYLIDLKNDDFEPIHLTKNFKQPFAPHGISFFKTDSTYKVMAVNHTQKGHSLEVFELYDKRMTHIKTLEHPSMISPNDVVMIDEDRFYFTNDHKYTQGLGLLAENYLGLGISNVIFFDGSRYNEVANGIAYANGINIDNNRDLIFVASPRHFEVEVFAMNKDGTLTFNEAIDCGTGVDNIEFDQEGNLWIGSHPNLLRFSSYAKGNKETSPSEIIKIDYRKKGDYSIEKIYVEEGSEMSGSTVAATFGDLIFMGNVMDEEFLILQRNTKP